MNILFIGGHNWDGPWFRKQHFAKRLSDSGHKVFYVEDSISIVRWNFKERNHLYKFRINKINDNLYIVTPPVYLPYPTNYYLRLFYNYRFIRKITKELNKYCVNDFVLWFNRIEYATILKNFANLKIFDLCDDLPGYAKLANNHKVYKQQMRFLKQCYQYSDIPIVSAYKIKEKYLSLTNKEIIVIPNGHNLHLTGTIPYPIPNDIASIRRPIIGFIGTLFHFIDDELLNFIICKRPYYNFVFIGGIEASFPLKNISNFDNVHILGKKPQELINNYINSFDLCINPFKVHEVNDSVNPVKVFEYLAHYKPVVSTRMYSLMKENISDYIIFSNDYNDFLSNIDKILASARKNDIPNDILSYYNWDNLYKKLLNSVQVQYSVKF